MSQCGSFDGAVQMTDCDYLRAEPIVQLREIEVPPLPIFADRVAWERAGPGLAEYSFGMHVKEARGVLRPDGCFHWI